MMPVAVFIDACCCVYRWVQGFAESLKQTRIIVLVCISLVPRRSEGRGERAPGTHHLRMRLISEISRKIGYFSNPPCNNDV